MIPSDGLLYASKYENMLFFETSVKNGMNVDIAYDAIVPMFYPSR